MASGRVSKVKGKVVDLPNAPTIGTATAGAESASVEFTASSSSKGGPTFSYRAVSNPGSIVGTSSSSPITVSGLTANTNYTFTVAAVNPTGYSEYTAPSNQVTPTERSGYFQIATVSPTSGGTVTLSNIPQTYTHLQIRFSLGMSGGGDSGLYFRVNGDTSNTYWWHDYYFSGNSGYAQGSSLTSDIFITNHAQFQSPNENWPTGGYIDILNYTSSQKKVVKIMASANTLSNSEGGSWGSALYDKTDAITSISFVAHGSYAFNKGKVGLFGIR